MLLPRKVINLLSYVKTIFSDVNSKAEKNRSLVFWVPLVFCNPFLGAFEWGTNVSIEFLYKSRCPREIGKVQRSFLETFNTSSHRGVAGVYRERCFLLIPLLAAYASYVT